MTSPSATSRVATSDRPRPSLSSTRTHVHATHASPSSSRERRAPRGGGAAPPDVDMACTCEWRDVWLQSGDAARGGTRGRQAVGPARCSYELVSCTGCKIRYSYAKSNQHSAMLTVDRVAVFAKHCFTLCSALCWWRERRSDAAERGQRCPVTEPFKLVGVCRARQERRLLRKSRPTRGLPACILSTRLVRDIIAPCRCH